MILYDRIEELDALDSSFESSGHNYDTVTVETRDRDRSHPGCCQAVLWTQQQQIDVLLGRIGIGQFGNRVTAFNDDKNPKFDSPKIV